MTHVVFAIANLIVIYYNKCYCSQNNANCSKTAFSWIFIALYKSKTRMYCKEFVITVYLHSKLICRLYINRSI